MRLPARSWLGGAGLPGAAVMVFAVAPHRRVPGSRSSPSVPSAAHGTTWRYVGSANYQPGVSEHWYG